MRLVLSVAQVRDLERLGGVAEHDDFGGVGEEEVVPYGRAWRQVVSVWFMRLGSAHHTTMVEDRECFGSRLNGNGMCI